MRPCQFAPLVGLATAVLVSIPTQAQAAVFQVDSGVTSVFLDLPLLDSAAGLVLTGTENTVDPASGPFQVGFTITADTDFSFSDEGTFTFLGGSIEHEGTVTFNDSVTVGDFSIGFDADRINSTTGASGFFVQDTASLGAILFDLTNVVPSLTGDVVTIDGDLLVSSEFAGFLGDQSLTGAQVGSAQANGVVDTVVEEVPEPMSIISLLVMGGMFMVGRRRLKRLAA